MEIPYYNLVLYLQFKFSLKEKPLRLLCFDYGPHISRPNRQTFVYTNFKSCDQSLDKIFFISLKYFVPSKVAPFGQKVA